ncbi:uncharacterized protein LOC135847005 [Planococcus citri]|uniref:uncharacterized protein LOC135847005 n=1 Tax=Planococcus citri TaxID=170843 RepID=UPI0031F7CAB5
MFFNVKKSVLVYFCVVIVEELCPASVCGQFPYPGVFYPPGPPFTSSPAMHAPPPQFPFPFPFYPPPAPYVFGSQCFAADPRPLAEQSQPPVRSNVNLKPRIVKPLRVPGSNPIILPNRVDSNSRPIIISTRSSRAPHQEPTLLSPFTNLVHTFLKSLAPRTCDCDGDFR